MNLKTKDFIASTLVSSIFLLFIASIIFLISYFFGVMSIIFGLAALKAIDLFKYLKNIIVRVYKS